MNRRGFLGALFALGALPSLPKAGPLSPFTHDDVLDSCGYTKILLASGWGRLASLAIQTQADDIQVADVFLGQRAISRLAVARDGLALLIYPQEATPVFTANEPLWLHIRKPISWSAIWYDETNSYRCETCLQISPPTKPVDYLAVLTKSSA